MSASDPNMHNSRGEMLRLGIFERGGIHVYEVYNYVVLIHIIVDLFDLVIKC